jgi:hypothetical protein
MDKALHDYIVKRDGGCIGRFVNNPFYAKEWPMLQGLPDHGDCRDEWGNQIDPRNLGAMSVDHVKDSLRTGKRAEDDRDHAWTCCPFRHYRMPWVTIAAVREAAREYIPLANERADKRGFPQL